jgi:hypothetical protein
LNFLVFEKGIKIYRKGEKEKTQKKTKQKKNQTHASSSACIVQAACTMPPGARLPATHQLTRDARQELVQGN